MARSLHAAFSSALSRRAGIRLFRFFCRSGAGEPAAPSGGIVLRRAGLAEALALCADPAFDLTEEKVREAFGRGDECIVAFERGRAVAYCWVAFSALPHLDGVWVDFPAGSSWIYKSFVLPSHRGRGIAPALYRAAHDAGTARGRERSIICVETHNAASVHAARKGGYSECGGAAWLRLGGRVAAWRTPAARRAAIRFCLPGGR